MEQRLVPDAPLTYNLMTVDDSNAPPTVEEFAAVALSGATKTRQVHPFRIPGSAKDYIVEVNEAEPAYIYCRNTNGETFRIIPLPGTEGITNTVWSRAADVVVQEDAIYVVVAMNFYDNLVYTVDMSLLTEESALTPFPTCNLHLHLTCLSIV